MSRITPQRQAAAVLSAIRHLVLPDGGVVVLEVSHDVVPEAPGLTWAVILQKDGVSIGEFTLCCEDGAVPHPGPHPSAVPAYWQASVRVTPTPPDSALTVLSALALTSHTPDGLPRTGGLLGLSALSDPVDVTTDPVHTALASAATTAGLAGAWVYGGLHPTFLVLHPGDVPLPRLSAAFLAGQPLPAHDAAHDAAEALRSLEERERHFQTAPDFDAGRLLATRRLAAMAALGHLPHDRVQAWFLRTDDASTGPRRTEQRIDTYLDARLIWDNCPGIATTDPVRHVQEFARYLNWGGMLWWFLHSHPSVWHRAVAWAIAQDAEMLNAMLRRAPGTLLAALTPDLLAGALSVADGRVRAMLITVQGAAHGVERTAIPSIGWSGRRP